MTDTGHLNPLKTRVVNQCPEDRGIAGVPEGPGRIFLNGTRQRCLSLRSRTSRPPSTKPATDYPHILTSALVMG